MIRTVASATWLRMCGEDEVGSVSGLKKAELRADARRRRDGSGPCSASSPLPVEEPEPGWWLETVRLYDAYSTPLLRYLLGVGLADAAEDVVQESFFRLARHLKHGGSSKNLRSWLYQVAHNLSMDIYRETHRELAEPEGGQLGQDALAAPGANPEWRYLEEERLAQLRIRMSVLTEQQLNSLILRAEGLRYREIAEALGVSEQRAIRLVKRGAERLAGGQQRS